ncbi:MAG TPA: methylated-DNA--[protein]-cysteine S-methyltransferase [Caulobacteraceae bacterium]|nr:methylated-DNA--[protein]-cysteine S-methyltransferase [Caulobacteraceae bacterium]
MLYEEMLQTPTGAFRVVTDETGRVRRANWADREPMSERPQTPRAPSAAAKAFAAYFAGDISALDGLEVETGGTGFQRQVWAALRRVPAGATVSYKDIAVAIGRPSATRAVGLANGANPAALVVPCHRVIGADGSLTGYGGGLERKRWLIEHERAAAVRAAA